MRALRIYAGPRAYTHLSRQGLHPQDVATIPAAAGGPKGLILGELDRFLFGQWLPQSSQAIHLIGASIGAWRMATACLNDADAAFSRLSHDYIHQDFKLLPGNKMPSAQSVSEAFAQNLNLFYGGRIDEVLSHPRYRLHALTSHGRHILHREQPLITALGYAGAFVSNTLSRKAMGAWLERVVFSSGQDASPGSVCAPLPFAVNDYRTKQVRLTAENFLQAVQASCSIPFALMAVHDIPGALPGAYWDGGITDYHLHLNYADPSVQTPKGLVLYPHFQKSVVPGWLDKSLRWRHRATHHLDTMVLLAPDPDWVKTLPNGKLPDRTDFIHYGHDFAGRVKVWQQGVQMSAQLVDEFQSWLDKPDMAQVQAL